MKRHLWYGLVCPLFFLGGCGPAQSGGEDEESLPVIAFAAPADPDLIYPDEKYFVSMYRLTDGGDNAEAYWSPGQTKLVFQATRDDWNAPCDQIFIYDLLVHDGPDATPPMMSTGRGRTTCSYFMPDGKSFLYASTHHRMDECPPVPERTPGGPYVWPIYPEYDIFVADLEGNILRQLTDNPGYDAEATVSPKGDLIVFTSMRTGDLELFTMRLDGSDVRQITFDLGYDGGAFFSPDGTQIIFRASRPQTVEEIAQYKGLLAQGLVQPTEMELFVCNVDGSNMRQITNLGNANWAPFFHPSGEKVIFSSNHASERGFPFNLYMIYLDGSGLEQITFDDTFDSFPMFSPDGRYLAFSSNRHNRGTRETNLFVAEWRD